MKSQSGTGGVGLKFASTGDRQNVFIQVVFIQVVFIQVVFIQVVFIQVGTLPLWSSKVMARYLTPSNRLLVQLLIPTPGQTTPGRAIAP
jgi:hypothetical protein